MQDMLWAFVPVAIVVTLTPGAVLRTRVVRWMERMTGVVMLGLGVRVALEGR